MCNCSCDKRCSPESHNQRTYVYVWSLDTKGVLILPRFQTSDFIKLASSDASAWSSRDHLPFLHFLLTSRRASGIKCSWGHWKIFWVSYFGSHWHHQLRAGIPGSASHSPYSNMVLAYFCLAAKGHGELGVVTRRWQDLVARLSEKSIRFFPNEPNEMKHQNMIWLWKYYNAKM